MRRLRTLALLAIAAGLSACVLSQDTIQYDLPSGGYQLTYQSVPVNACFPTLPKPFTDLIPLQVSGVSAQVEALGFLSALTTTMVGTYQEDELQVSGHRILTVSTSCVLDLVESLGATVFAPGPELAVGFSVGFDANTTTTAGLPSVCQSHAGGSYQGLPFPVLSNPTNGICSYGVEGVASPLSL